MTISFKCGKCGAGLRVADTHAGRSVKCPKCAAPLTVPAATLATVGRAASSAVPSPAPAAQPPTSSSAARKLEFRPFGDPSAEPATPSAAAQPPASSSAARKLEFKPFGDPTAEPAPAAAAPTGRAAAGTDDGGLDFSVLADGAAGSTTTPAAVPSKPAARRLDFGSFEKGAESDGTSVAAPAAKSRNHIPYEGPSSAPSTSGTSAGSPSFVPYEGAPAKGPQFVPYDEPQQPPAWPGSPAPTGPAAWPGGPPGMMPSRTPGQWSAPSTGAPGTDAAVAAIAMGKVPWNSTLNGLMVLTVAAVLISLAYLTMAIPAAEMVSGLTTGPAKGKAGNEGFAAIGGLILIVGGLALPVGGMICSTAPAIGKVRFAGMATAGLALLMVVLFIVERSMEGSVKSPKDLGDLAIVQTLRHVVTGLMFGTMFLHLNECTKLFGPNVLGPRFVGGAVAGAVLQLALAVLSVMQFSVISTIAPGRVTGLATLQTYLTWYVIINLGGNIVILVSYAVVASKTRNLMSQALDGKSGPGSLAYPVGPAGAPGMPPSPFFHPGAAPPPPQFFQPGPPPGQPPQQPPTGIR